MVGYPLSGKAQLAVPCTTHHKWRYAVCEPLWITWYVTVLLWLMHWVTLQVANLGRGGWPVQEVLRKVQSSFQTTPPISLWNPVDLKLYFSRHFCVCQKLLKSSNLRPQGKATPFSVDNYSLFGNTPYWLLALTEMECPTGQHMITQPELFSSGRVLTACLNYNIGPTEQLVTVGWK